MNRRTRPYVAFGFASVHDTLEAESVLSGAGVSSDTFPSPRELGDLCGIALRVEPSFVDAARAAFADAGLSPRAEAEITDY